MTTWIIVAIVIAVIVIAAGWYMSARNDFARLRNLVDESWQQVAVELQRRHDLVPMLVATVSRAADLERSVLDSVTRARAEAVTNLEGADSPDVAAVSKAENLLSSALTRMQAVAEAYPQVQSVRSYDALRRDFADTEDRIAASRRLYNGNVRALNTRIDSVPASLVASAHHIEHAEYFEISDPAVRTAPDPDRLFGGDPQAPSDGE